MTARKPTADELRRTRARQARIQRELERRHPEIARNRRRAEAPRLKAAAERQKARELVARREAQLAERHYRDLASEVRALGGIRVDRDYTSAVVPREWRGRRALDDLNAELSGRGAHHFEYADDLLAELHHRRDTARAKRAKARGDRARPVRSRERIKEWIRRNRAGEYSGTGREDNSRWANRDRLGRFAPARGKRA